PPACRGLEVPPDAVRPTDPEPRGLARNRPPGSRRPAEADHTGATSFPTPLDCKPGVTGSDPDFRRAQRSGGSRGFDPGWTSCALGLIRRSTEALGLNDRPTPAQFRRPRGGGGGRRGDARWPPRPLRLIRSHAEALGPDDRPAPPYLRRSRAVGDGRRGDARRPPRPLRLARPH